MTGAPVRAQQLSGTTGEHSFPAANPTALENYPDPSFSTPSPLPLAMVSKAPPVHGSTALRGLCVGSRLAMGPHGVEDMWMLQGLKKPVSLLVTSPWGTGAPLDLLSHM